MTSRSLQDRISLSIRFYIERMSRLRTVHWLAPTTMLMSLLGGYLLVLGHHFFYANLDHKLVMTQSYSFPGNKLPPQQLNISIGTALALLVKICLAIAVSTAYVQMFWRSTSSAKQRPTLVELDLATSSLTNIVSLCSPKFSLRYPLLVLPAIIFWSVFLHR